MRVAYQGEAGAFSESAARRILGGDIVGVPCHSFERMFAAVGDGDADCCVAPIENSLAGSIHRNYDLLLESQLTIAGETSMRIVHNLIAPPDAALDRIRRVYSHPVALAQCARFFTTHPHLEAVPVHDTAGGVRMVMDRRRDDEGAIASATAAEIYGGRVLLESIEDNAQNYTRFFLLTAADRARDVVLRETPRRWKTSIVFRVANKPGALFRALGAFAIFEIDLSKIESRPVAGRPWEYAFYLDLAGKSDDAQVSRALDNLIGMAEMVRILGSYPTRW
ncbi:MAG TPA: prephenate dehydratase [Thermoanaerobaculia bacterium]|nr:prephenate dehydratase [Thermoanaerobaculia bacterium]